MSTRVAVVLIIFFLGIVFGQTELTGQNFDNLLWVRVVTNMAPSAAFYLTSDERSVVTATYGNPNQPYIPVSLDLLTRNFDTNGSIDRLWGNLVTLSDGGLIRQPVRIDDEYETARILGDVHSRWVIRSNGRSTPIPTRFIATRRNTLFAVGLIGAITGAGEESLLELDGYRPNLKIAKIGEFPPLHFEGPPAGFAAESKVVIFSDIVGGVAKKNSFYLADTKALTLGRLFSWDPRWQRFTWPNNSGRTPVVSTPDEKIIVSIVRDPGGNQTQSGLAVVDVQQGGSPRIIEFPFGPLLVTGMAVGRDGYIYCSLSDRSHSAGPRFRGGVARVNFNSGEVFLIGNVTNTVEAPPIITKSGTLLVASWDAGTGNGNIHAIATDSVAGLAKSPWPRSTGDNFDSYREQVGDETDGIGIPDTKPSPHVGVLIHPQSTNASIGGTITLTVVATNAASYQWLKNGVAITGATNSILTLNNLSTSEEGDYRVVVSVGKTPDLSDGLKSRLAEKGLTALNYWVQDVSFYEGTTSSDSRYIQPHHLGQDGRIVGEYQDNRVNRGQAFVTGPNGVGLVKLGQLFGNDRSVATSINERNQIVGWVNEGRLPSFSIQSDLLLVQDINYEKNSYTIINDVNNYGDMVGNVSLWFQNVGLQKPQPFVVNGNGGLFRLLGGLSDSLEGDALSINNSGQIAGWSRIQYNGEQRAFITGANGLGIRDLGVLGGSEVQGSNSVATAINNLGQVVGGSSFKGGDLHAFITDPNGGKMRDIGTLGGGFSCAYDINDSGQVVGWSYTNLATAPVSHAFVTGENGVGIFDLNSFVQLENGAQFVTAYANNNRGQILADANGRSYLLTPTTVVSRIATVGVECSDFKLTNGLIAYYSFNGDAKDESSLGNHGVIRGGVSGTADRNGIANAALDFPGNGGSYVFVGEFPSKLVTNALTVSFWLTFNGGSESPRVFNNYDRSRTIASTGSSSIRRINYHLTYGFLQSPDMIENKWYHVVVVETLGGGKMFVNGSLVSQTTWDIQKIDFYKDFDIGRNIQGHEQWSGKLDDFRVYNCALSECAVKSLFEFETSLPINRAPTLNALADMKLLQNAPSQTVNLSGIGSGAVDEIQGLTVTATSDNPALIANPLVTYTSPNATGTLTYQPVAGATGKATITVTVKDDGGVLNGGQDTFSRQFTVTVSPINRAPTLNVLADVKLLQNAPRQTVSLSGIGSGAVDEVQTLTITATSDNPALITNPMVAYTSPNATGTLTYQPVAGTTGKATITVTVKDDGGVLNGGQDTFTRQFTVTVAPINRAPTLNALADVKLLQNAPSQTVNLSGIGSGAVDEVQGLAVTATSDNPALIANPMVKYTSPNATGTLTYQPVVGATGKATITVTVKDDGGVLNGGQDTFSRQFTVEVTKTANKAPEVQIVSPQDGTTTTVDVPITLVADAKDSDGTISQVEFYKNSNQLIGTVSSSPYQLVVGNLTEGKYTFYAKATDNSGLSGVSKPITINVLGERRDVAIVKVSPDEHIDTLAKYVSEVQLSNHQDSLTWRVFEVSEISYEILSQYRVVIWNNPNPIRGVSMSEVQILKQLIDSGVPAYFIGANIATSANALGLSEKRDWSRLTSLIPAGDKTQLVNVEVRRQDDHSSILDGFYGRVDSFAASDMIDQCQSITNADTLAATVDGVVFVSYPTISKPDNGETRRFSQLLPVIGKGDSRSIEERQRIFKNALCWLIDCNRCPVVNLAILADESANQSAQLTNGDPFRLKAYITTQNAECPATGIRAVAEFNGQASVLDAQTERGTVSMNGGKVYFSFGRIGVHESVPIEILLKFNQHGNITNTITAFANGMTSKSVIEFSQQFVVSVSPSLAPTITADRGETGNIRLRVGGQSGIAYVIEKSTAIAGNGQIQWSALKEIELNSLEHIHIHVIEAPTSSMMFRVRKK